MVYFHYKKKEEDDEFEKLPVHKVRKLNYNSVEINF